jgi:putative transposase
VTLQDHLAEVYGVQASPALMSNITDVVVEEITLWQNRPVDEVSPIVDVDALRGRVQDKGAVTQKAAHLVGGVDVDGRQPVLGIGIDETDSAKFGNQLLTQVRHRGLKDILILCGEGLTGPPDAARSVFPDTVIHTCVVPVIRNATKFVSFGDRKKVSAALRALDTAPTVEAAELALIEFRKEFGKQHSGSVAVWERA